MRTRHPYRRTTRRTDPFPHRRSMATGGQAPHPDWSTGEQVAIRRSLAPASDSGPQGPDELPDPGERDARRGDPRPADDDRVEPLVHPVGPVRAGPRGEPAVRELALHAGLGDRVVRTECGE